jgi:Mg2+ and Co2+ transporter CorA
MMVAAERLAMIAGTTLPVTAAAISPVMGMNVIVIDSTNWPWLTVLLVAAIGLSRVRLRWARRQGWW